MLDVGCFQAFDSPDGQNWGWVGTENNSLPQPVFEGLAVSSHDDSRVAAAQLDGVRLQPSVPANAPTPVVGQGDGLQGSYYNGPALSGTPVWGGTPGYQHALVAL